jgi:hypothetical protein
MGNLPSLTTAVLPKQGSCDTLAAGGALLWTNVEGNEHDHLRAMKRVPYEFLKDMNGRRSPHPSLLFKACGNHLWRDPDVSGSLVELLRQRSVCTGSTVVGWHGWLRLHGQSDSNRLPVTKVERHRTMAYLSSRNISIDPCLPRNARSAMMNPVNVTERVVIAKSPFAPDGWSKGSTVMR